MAENDLVLETLQYGVFSVVLAQPRKNKSKYFFPIGEEPEGFNFIPQLAVAVLAKMRQRYLAQLVLVSPCPEGGVVLVIVL